MHAECTHAQLITALEHEPLSHSLFAAWVVTCVYDFIFATSRKSLITNVSWHFPHYRSTIRLLGKLSVQSCNVIHSNYCDIFDMLLWLPKCGFNVYS
uniref:Uncharacterized protein n=1 Tax=Rhipicephalus zambeziensis TaxID=60191 RepID=A0A224Y9V4_9ACAR